MFAPTFPFNNALVSSKKENRRLDQYRNITWPWVGNKKSWHILIWRISFDLGRQGWWKYCGGAQRNCFDGKLKYAGETDKSTIERPWVKGYLRAKGPITSLSQHNVAHALLCSNTTFPCGWLIYFSSQEVLN